jgi:MerR family transcriptional regulator, repressor of the yfmOP operon
MSAVAPTPAVEPPVAALRIGELARRVGTTPRTIRYYEELGLLGGGSGAPREAGQHRLYGPGDEERLREVMRLKDLLGVSLDELRTLVEAEDARALLRDEWHHGTPSRPRRRTILAELTIHLDNQLALLRRRRDELVKLESELVTKHERVQELQRELDAEA